jgi:hypothetical protein
MRKREDIGCQVIDDAYQTLRVDAEWSARKPREFVWWGHNLAQRVWAEPARESHGLEVIWVHAETDLLCDVPKSPRTAQSLAALNRFASLSGLIWYSSQGHVKSHCSAYFHDENYPWLRQVFLSALAIQAATAHSALEEYSGLLDARQDLSQHPENGPRPKPDELLSVIDSLYGPAGSGPSAFSKGDVEQALKMEPNPWVMANGDGTEMVAEFPFSESLTEKMEGPGTALLIISADMRHPQLGSGAFLRLMLPISMEPTRASALSCMLNITEANQWTGCHLLGAWCTDDEGSLCFVTFLPTLLHGPGLLEAMIWNAALHAKWAGSCIETTLANQQLLVLRGRGSFA